MVAIASSIKGITIEIGGDTTKLTQALKEPNAQIKDLRDGLRNVNYALKLDTTNVDLLNRKQSLLTSTISSTEEKLKILKDAQKQYIDSGKDLNTAEYTELQKQIIICEKQLKDLAAQQNIFNGNVQAMGIKLTEFGQKATKAGTTLTKGITAPIVGIGIASTKAWKELDQAYDNIAAGTGAVGDDLKELQNSFDNVYGSFAFDSEDVGIAIADINTRLGLTEDSLEDAAAQFLKFAEVNNTDVSGAIESVSKAMADAGIETSELNTVLDKLTVASQASGMSVDDITSSLSKNGIAMRQLGYNTDETIALLTTFEKNGVDTATMLTGMRAAFKNCANSGKDAKTELKKFFQSVEDGTVQAGDASELFGSKAGAAIEAYAREGKLNISEMMDVIAQSTDGLNNTFEEMQDPADQFAIAMNNAKLAGADLGKTLMDTLAPMIQKVIDKVKSWTNWFKQLDPSTKQLIVKVGLMAAALGPLLIGIGKLSTGLGSMIKFFGSATSIGGKLITTIAGFTGGIGPAVAAIGGITAAIGVLIGAFVTLWNNSEEFREKITSIFDGIKQKISDFCQGIVDRINDLGFNFKDITEVISSIWNGFCELLAPVFEGAFAVIGQVLSVFLDLATGILDILIGLFTGDWEKLWIGVQEVFSGVWQFIGDFIQTIVDTIVGVVQTFLSWFGINWDLSFISDAWNACWQGISKFVDGIFKGIQKLFNSFVKLFQGDWNGFCKGISQVWSGIWNGISSFASGIWNGIKNLASSIWNGISSFFSNCFNGIKTNITNVWSSIKNFFSDTWNGIKTTASNMWNGLVNVIMTPINKAKELLGNAINTIKGFFNFQIQWPKIPLPHFSISGSLNPFDWFSKGLPRIGLQWYAKAMDQGTILSKPTIFGMQNGRLLAGGEAGDEAVVGVKSLSSMIDRTVRNAFEKSRISQASANVQTTEIDYDKLANAMIAGLSGSNQTITINLDKRTLASELTPLVDKNLERRKNRR